MKYRSRHERRLNKHSRKFNDIFNFFLVSHRSGILTFSGTVVDTVFLADAEEAKMTFRKFDNGDFLKNEPIPTIHPNIVYAVIKGKKSWGLFLNQWTDGIVDWTFTLDEIIGIFSEHNITIPDSLWKDFLNVLDKKKEKRNIDYLNRS